MTYADIISIAADWANILLVTAAIITLRYAYQEVMALHKSHEQAQLHSKATFLLELDRRWDSDSLKVPRSEFRKIITEVDKLAISEKNHRTPKEIREYSKDIYAQKLLILERDKRVTYDSLKEIMEFFETVGYIARSNYIPVSDVINLFGGIILTVGRVFGGHIEHVQSRPGTTGRAYEHIVWLTEKVQETAKRTRR